MDFDLNQFDDDIKHYNDVRVGIDIERLTFGAIDLSERMSGAIYEALPQINEHLPQAEKDKLFYLCSKMTEFYPTQPDRYILWGRVYGRCGEFEMAAKVLKAGYDTIHDPTQKLWPHVEPSRKAGWLLVYLGSSLDKLGQKAEGERFFEVGKKMIQEFGPAIPSSSSVPPPEPL